MGGIGRSLARRALGFDMKIIYFNRNKWVLLVLGAMIIFRWNNRVDDTLLKDSGLLGKVQVCSNDRRQCNTDCALVST